MFGRRCLPDRWRWWPLVRGDSFIGNSQEGKPDEGIEEVKLATAQSQVILFFDVAKQRTIAVLSSSMKELVSEYFQCRVAQGTATSQSPLYYELDGYLRENWTQLRHQKGIGLQFTVIVAVGALEASDKAQSEILEKQEKEIMASTRQKQQPNVSEGDPSLFESALEICRLHRLGEDLDVFSVYCLGRTGNRICRQIAISLATQRLRQAQLELIPLVDGCPIGGLSTFMRLQSDRNNDTFIQYGGRPMEYVQFPSIPLTLASDTCPNKFIPKQAADDADITVISWGCIELAFSNLEQWWGECKEYSGQKLQIRWQPSEVDIVKTPRASQSTNQHPPNDESQLPVDAQAEQQGHAQQLHCNNKYLDIACLRIEGEVPKQLKKWTASRFCSITLRILESQVTQLDDVEMCYRGSLQFVQAHVDFRALVRAYVKKLLVGLQQEKERIEEQRPLLSRERNYFQAVERAAAPTYV